MALVSRPALSKHARFAFGIQTAEGTEFLSDHASTDLNVVPWNATLDFGRNPNLEIYRQADYLDHDHLVFSSGEWWEGGVPMVLQPEAAVITDLISWIQDRDAYNQGEFASVYIEDQWRSRAIMDVKVREASITATKGRPVDFALQLVGKQEGSEWPDWPDVIITGPYVWHESTVTVDVDGSTLAAEYEFETFEIRIDNALEDPGEGLRLTSGKNPRRLYNLSGIRCSGTLTRDFIDDTYRQAWILQIGTVFSNASDGALRLVLTRVATPITLDMPRIKWMNVRDDLPGDNESRISSAIDWQGLGAHSAVLPLTQVPPITLS